MHPYFAQVYAHTLHRGLTENAGGEEGSDLARRPAELFTPLMFTVHRLYTSCGICVLLVYPYFAQVYAHTLLWDLAETAGCGDGSGSARRRWSRLWNLRRRADVSVQQARRPPLVFARRRCNVRANSCAEFALGAFYHRTQFPPWRAHSDI